MSGFVLLQDGTTFEGDLVAAGSVAYRQRACALSAA